MAAESAPDAQNDAAILNLLQSEAMAALQYGQESKRRQEQLLAIAGAASAALVTVGVTKNSSLPFLVLPSLVCFIIAFTQRVTLEIILFGMYRQYLERKINTLLRSEVLIWEQGVVELEHASIRRGRFGVLLAGGLLGCMILVASVAGGIKAATDYSANQSILIVYCCVTSLGLLAVGVNYYEANSIFKKVPNAIERSLESSRKYREQLSASLPQHESRSIQVDRIRHILRLRSHNLQK